MENTLAVAEGEIRRLKKKIDDLNTEMDRLRANSGGEAQLMLSKIKNLEEDLEEKVSQVEKLNRELKGERKHTNLLASDDERSNEK